MRLFFLQCIVIKRKIIQSTIHSKQDGYMIIVHYQIMMDIGEKKY